MVQPPSSSSNDALCVVCKSPINPGAIKCTTCDCYQSIWRRLLADLNIQALLALIPIATLAFVFIKDQIITPAADLRLAALDCASDQVEVAAANLGNRDAIFAGAMLQPADSTRTIPLRLDQGQEKNLLVPAGETRIYKLLAIDDQGNSLGLGLSRKTPCRYHLRPRVIAFQHATKSEESLCACPES